MSGEVLYDKDGVTLTTYKDALGDGYRLGVPISQTSRGGQTFLLYRTEAHEIASAILTAGIKALALKAPPPVDGTPAPRKYRWKRRHVASALADILAHYDLPREAEEKLEYTLARLLEKAEP